jgi:methionine-S-sulfoxide reductase
LGYDKKRGEKQSVFENSFESKELLMNKPMIYMAGLFVLSVIGFAFAGNEGSTSDATEEKIERATFAGGCFWCMQPPFDKLEGVIGTTVGYTGGSEENPTYKEVSLGKTGHAEAIEIVYDPSRITYEKLLDVFWRNIDPTQIDGQFVDIGRQYRTAVFHHNEEQRRLAMTSKEALENSDRFEEKIVTEIVPATEFYRAEEYHQDYYKKNPVRYKFYRYGSGRDQFLKKVWGEGS